MDANKKRILDEIEAHAECFKPVSPIRYRFRCPICGDSPKNLRDSHCYIKCSNDDSEPILYRCFLCNAKGMVNAYFLKKLGVKNPDQVLKMDQKWYHRIPSIKNTDINIITSRPMMDSPQVRYIHERLGEGFTEEDFDRFKIIWNFDSIRPFIRDQRTRNTLPCNVDSISFLADDRSCLLTRTFQKDGPWRKTKILSTDDTSFYTIKSSFNLFTEKEITVNIAEGIFDILSVYKNFNDGEYSAYIATLGSDYINGVQYAIAKGFVGKNIVVKIYMDNDQSMTGLKQKLKSYRWLFRSIILIQNARSKDVGVPIDQIMLLSRKI